MLPIKIQKKIVQIFLSVSLCVILINITQAQSSDSEYPTSVTSNEVAGKIEPRDVGDPRLTRHFFAFNGTNGDLNINIESENLNGDVDVFTVNGLRPLTKVGIFDTGSKSTTAVSIYVRRREPLLLRVEARTASDNVGTYRISFSGGFESIADTGPQPTAPTVNISQKEGVVRLNAVGARIEQPKPPVQPKTETKAAEPETITKASETAPDPTKVKTEIATTSTTTNTDSSNATSSDTSSTAKRKQETSAEERRRAKAEAKAEADRKWLETLEARAEAKRIRREEAAEAERKRKEEAAEAKALAKLKREEDAAKALEERKQRQEAAEQQRREMLAKAEASRANKNNLKTKPDNETKSSKAIISSTSNPLFGMRLIIETNEGEHIEYKMSDINRVSVEKGAIVIVFVNEKLEKLLITKAAKMTIAP